MKFLIYLLLIPIIFSCSTKKGVYWCGDHPCINKKEKEAYFKKTMTVEVKNIDKKSLKNDSDSEKLIKEAKINEKKRILSEKDIKKQAKIEKKRREKEEKDFEKQRKLDEKRMLKEEKQLEKQAEIQEKKKIKERKKIITKNQIENKNILKQKETTDINLKQEKLKFEQIVKSIYEKNSVRSFPDINNTPN